MESWKDIALHLSIVTVGILIALGLESAVEWRRHQELAAEARANILSEMKENRAKVADLVKQVPKLQQGQAHVIQYLENVLAHKTNAVHELSLGWSLKPILDSGWSTAQSVGALSFLHYDEVKEYAEVYNLQRVFVATAQKGAEQTSTAIGFFGQDRAPETFQDWELKNEIELTQQAYGSMFAQAQLGQALVNEYDKVLKKEK